MTMPALLRSSALLTLLALGACASTPAPVQPSPAASCSRFGASPFLHLTMMFGMTRPHGPPVTQAEWTDFLATTITPQFPAGLTVQASDGQWRDQETGRITREPSRLVHVITPDSPALEEQIRTIRDAYKQRFSQQAVGLLISHDCASF